MSIFRILAVLVLLAAMFFGIRLLLDLLFHKGEKKARAEAARLGLEPTSVVRHVAGQQRDDSWEFFDTACVRYRAPVAMRRNAQPWQLLVRPDGAADGFPRYTQVAGSDLPDALLVELRSITKGFADGEFLEFESSADGLFAYWEESGGAKGAQEISQYLSRLAKHDPNVAA